MSVTRVCHDCLKNYRRKNKGAQKPWPKYLHHEGHDRLCEYHRAKAAEYSSVAKGKRALRKVAWSDSAKINTVYREAAKRRASGEKVHVDHEIPLCGKNVSGLHVDYNLKVIPASENIRKSNKF